MITIHHGDSLAVLRTLPSDSVHCCVTSPPYWGLRNYNVYGQIGMESCLADHISTLVEVFREVKRVLRKDGTLWLNYGDAYACAPNGRSAADVKAIGNDDRTFRDKPMSTVGPIDKGRRIPRGSGRWGGGNTDAKRANLKPKDRMLLPARVAIALQEDGWWIRDEIIWHKPNPMPSSVRDRCTPAHEMIYMLTKSAKYYYDQNAIRTPAKEVSIKRINQPNFENQQGGEKDYANGVNPNNSMRKALENWKKTDKQRGHSRVHEGFNERWDSIPKDEQQSMGANKRSVWTVAPHPFREAHFATFPPDLIEPCILAGCPEKCCANCGAPWLRVVNKEFIPQEDVSLEKGIRGAGNQKPLDESNHRHGFPRGSVKVSTEGWKASCKCNSYSAAGTVLDPFFGAGTTGLVSQKLNRDCIGIELNSDYIKIAEKRLGLVPQKARAFL